MHVWRRHRNCRADACLVPALVEMLPSNGLCMVLHQDDPQQPRSHRSFDALHFLCEFSRREGGFWSVPQPTCNFRWLWKWTAAGLTTFSHPDALPPSPTCCSFRPCLFRPPPWISQYLRSVSRHSGPAAVWTHSSAGLGENGAS